MVMRTYLFQRRWCHRPQRRTIQYAAAHRGTSDVSGILDAPPARGM